MLSDGMPAGAQWHLGQALWWRLDSCLLAKHDAPVAEEDVWRLFTNEGVVG